MLVALPHSLVPLLARQVAEASPEARLLAQFHRQQRTIEPHPGILEEEAEEAAGQPVGRCDLVDFPFPLRGRQWHRRMGSGQTIEPDVQSPNTPELGHPIEEAQNIYIGL